MLSIQKSPTDKTELGYIAHSSDIPFTSRTVFVEEVKKNKQKQKTKTKNKNKNKKQKNICCLVDARFSSFYYFLRTLVFSKFIIVCHYVGDDKTVLLFFLVCFVYNIYDMLV